LRARWRTIDQTAAMLRKCLILFNWLTPLTTITAPQPLPYASSSKLGNSIHASKKPPPPPPLLHTFLHAPPPVLLDLVNSLSDDIATFSRLGLIGKRIGEKAAKLADWCWFSGTLVGLVEVGVEQGLVRNLMDESKKHHSLLTKWCPDCVEAESRLYASTFADGVPPLSSTASPEVLAAERELEKLKRQYYWLQISRAKLLMDLIFVCESRYFGMGYHMLNASSVRVFQISTCSSACDGDGRADICNIEVRPRAGIQHVI
jgi:hypothetical protein